MPRNPAIRLGLAEGINERSILLSTETRQNLSPVPQTGPRQTQAAGHDYVDGFAWVKKILYRNQLLMLNKGIDVPDDLLKAQAAGELVIFAGAGVSNPPPSSLPLFGGLATQIGSGTGVEKE